MQNGGFVPWEDFTPVLHRDTVIPRRFLMLTEEELEQLATALIDREESAAAILIEDRQIEKRDVRT